MIFTSYLDNSRSLLGGSDYGADNWNKTGIRISSDYRPVCLAINNHFCCSCLAQSKQVIHDLLIERERYQDVIVVDSFDMPEIMGFKRFEALNWVSNTIPDFSPYYILRGHQATSTPASEYDFFMTMDTDTFIRFQYLSDRLHTHHPSARPRGEQILWGRFLSAKQCWEEASHYFPLTKEPFRYPSGLAYLMRHVSI
ncbi:hypothetical protein SISSUDRAFT_446712 [Sistotremastrum suecicum HHB10207 ss-3]|uniref:Hexosyltransferase n=1 Tax=Sistotremastrum suecicum HHB10207 ss-3 TaxID=1314776 RepID=A0A166FGA2_9AGAM|nr:hypothetical protein SISSUDRAFT_446712 [Sistotremastrum suecicum HHB10207 ss-3]